ncbi:MAG TPA: class I SAM-dependent methyltransferase [Thermoanaerobaculia bacterium]|nr:class I SAM-dependent methyltransferase [Thermoanaerobaculia bacterium]
MAAPLLEVGTLALFARELDGDLPDTPCPDGYRVREASAAELDAVLAGSDPERSAEALRERFRRGDACFVVQAPSGRIVHTRWLTADPPYVPELRRTLLLDKGDAYFYDGFTHADARRLGLDGVVRCAIFRAARTQGFSRVVSYVRADNLAGLRAARRWQRPAGSIRHVRPLRGGPWLFGTASIAPLEVSLEPNLDCDEGERAARSLGWRRWFEGWQAQPQENRSTGFSALPDEYFTATAEFVADCLELAPAFDSVLDVGCASAGVTGRVAASSRELTGVDAMPGLLRDAVRAGIRAAAGGPARFVAADARRLPLPSQAFDKVYCLGMIHTLPSRQDGIRVLLELVRVCRPGGKILVGSVPDHARRWRARAEAWRRGGMRERFSLLASLLLPGPLKSVARRLAGHEQSRGLVYLEYDFDALRRRLESLGLECRVVEFPGNFWSRDFRLTRSNLVVTLPE